VIYFLEIIDFVAFLSTGLERGYVFILEEGMGYALKVAEK